ncbi:hypothetical protein EP7_004489 [Isosphaeraceae bacterium EP7]
MSQQNLPASLSNAGPTEIAPVQPADPRRNPSYPRRLHTNERPHWEGVLRAWDERIAEAAAKLPGAANREALDYLHAQMLGGRDQIAMTARRLPQEVGAGYAEDLHLMERAIAALERVFQKWDAASKA